MADNQDSISPDLARWIEQQHVFFVATAPLAASGHVNCSPKGMDAFRVLGPHDVAYIDLTGSGVETIAHLKENGRIVFMFCAFDGAPRVVRLHGTGGAVQPDTSRFEELRERFPNYVGTRAIVTATITRISQSCGYAVPRLDYVDDRDALEKWAAKKGADGLDRYRRRRQYRRPAGAGHRLTATGDEAVARRVGVWDVETTRFDWNQTGTVTEPRGNGCKRKIRLRHGMCPSSHLVLTSRSQRLWVLAETVAWTLVAVGMGVLIARYVDRAFRARQPAVESAAHQPRSQTPDLAGVATTRQPDLTLWSPQRIAAWRTASTQPSATPLAVLRIPRINLEVPVLEGTSEATLNAAVGHVEATALPGVDGNAGIAGHCDGFFHGLENLTSGDAIELETLQGIERYRIQRTWIVTPDDVSVLDPTPNRSLTLMTCFPFDDVGSAPRRYIVRAVRLGRSDLARTADVSGF